MSSSDTNALTSSENMYFKLTSLYQIWMLGLLMMLRLTNA